jgi:hypothetical protein
MPKERIHPSAPKTKRVSEQAAPEGVHLSRIREANEVLALTLSIIRTPFGQMVPAQSPLSSEAEAGPA